MNVKEMTIRIANQILHQTDVEGIRQCIGMAIGVGFDLARKEIDNQKPVIKCDLNGNEVKRYVSISSAARENGIAISTIGQVVTDKTGRHKTAKGYKWKYADQLNNV